MKGSLESVAAVKALCFDVFGTVVDWRGSVIRECERLCTTKGLEIDCADSPTPGAPATSRR